MYLGLCLNIMILRLVHGTLISSETTEEINSSMRDRIMNITFNKYKPYERPESLSQTIISVNIRILAIFSIDVRTMDYNVDAYLRQNWNDTRLAWDKDLEFHNYNSSIDSPKLKEKIWLPDLFFRNGKEGFVHKMTQPNYLIRVSPNGEILYSQKITMKFSCPMDLHTFPMDTQVCEINIGSYAYTDDQLKFVWRAGDKPVIEIHPDLQIAEFQSPTVFNTSDCTDGYSTTTGRYSCIVVRFQLKRQIGYYLATTYIPNTLIILVSWLSFWVNVDAAPARVPLGLLSLLGILTQAASVSSILPRVSYIKAIDIWLIFSIIFVIGVLVEYAIALTVIRARKADSWHRDVKKIVHQELNRWCSACHSQQLMERAQTINLTSYNDAGLQNLLIHEFVNKHLEKSQMSKTPNPQECEVDTYSRFLFPACFILYSCFYWFYYLVLVEILTSETTKK